MSELDEKNTIYLKDNWFAFKIQFVAWARLKKVIVLLDGATPPYHQPPNYVTVTNDNGTSSSSCGGTLSGPADYETKRVLAWFKLIRALGDQLELARSVEDGNTVAIWRRLLSDFEPKTTASLQRQLKELLAAEQGMAGVNEYLDTLNITRTMLKNAIMERKIDLLDVIMQLVTVQGLNSRYEPLKQNRFVRGDDIPYAELCDTIKVNCQRIDISTGHVPGISLLYSTRQVGKSECPHCKSKGKTLYHDSKDCWSKNPSLRPPPRQPSTPAPAAQNSSRPPSEA